MFFKNKNLVRIGKVEKELELSKRFGDLKWRWRRRLFKHLYLQTGSMFNSHIMITGGSGTGKSNMCKQLLRQLAGLGCNFVVLDPHSEYVESAKEFGAEIYDGRINCINIFDFDGLSEKEQVAEITSMFRRIFRLGEVQAYTLHKCISYTCNICAQRGRTPTMHDLIYTIKVFLKHAGKTEANTLESLEKRLSVIAGDSYAKGVNIASVMKGRSIFSLASLHTAEAQAVYMEGMLKRIYTSLLSNGKPNRSKFYIVIDEAEKLQNSEVVARLVAEGRKYGVGIVAISQRAKALDKEIRSNAATIIAFAQREPEEQSYVANLIAGGNEYNRFLEVRKALRELGRGQALVQSASSRNPKIVSCARFEAISRDPSYRIIRLAERAISEHELSGVLMHEGFAREDVLDALRTLEGKGVLKQHFVNECKYKGRWYMTMPRNSAEHDIMVNLISRHLDEIGIRNVIYNKAYGPDVIAFAEGRRIAVEYETGMKDADSTAKMLEERHKAYSKVIVVGRNCVST